VIALFNILNKERKLIEVKDLYDQKKK